MERIFFTLILFLLGTGAHNAAPGTEPLKWRQVAAQYQSLADLKPILVNDGQESIFLSRIWPHGSAQLQRWNERMGKWETGDWGIGCGTVQNPTVPIEIPPGTEQAIHVYWQLSMDDWGHPQHFVVQGMAEKRPRAGKYRFFLRYAKTPWTVIHRPGRIYLLTSPEFQLTS